MRYTCYMKMILIILSFIILLSGCPTTINILPTEEPILPSYTRSSGLTYYVSASGSDSNNGLSEAAPWKSIEKLNIEILNFQPGDKILFNRGDVFRGNLAPSRGSSTNWLTYSTYGSGEKPIIQGSTQLNESGNWTNHSANIWKTTSDCDIDVGGLFLDSSTGERFWTLAELSSDGDFYFDHQENDKRLYLYNSGGSPPLTYSSIEASLKNHIVDLDERYYVLFEGLHLTMGSAHGLGGTDLHDIIIQDCDFSYIGGSYLYTNGDTPVRYGNGIEFWGDAERTLVQRNRFWEIYDTAVTNQGHGNTTTQKNIFYINNIMWNCGLSSFELWNRPSSSVMQNIYFINNTSVNPGYGWGGSAHRSDANSFHIASFANEAAGNDLVIKNNIFYTSNTPPNAENHLFFLDEDMEDEGYLKYIIDYNLWQMPDPEWAITTSTLYESFSAWQDINKQSSHGVEGDPLFTDWGNEDFSLSTASPAINTGEAITIRTDDFFENQEIGSPDMGAVEYGY